MITWTKRLVLTGAFLALVAGNILSVTSTAFHAALSGAIGSALGIRTVSGMMQGKLAARDRTISRQAQVLKRRKAAVRAFGTRLAGRTSRVAGKSIAAIPAEAVPFLGVAVLIADTGYEIYAACETMRDLDELYSHMGMEDHAEGVVLQNVCNPALPEPGEVWDGVMARRDTWLDGAREAI